MNQELDFPLAGKEPYQMSYEQFAILFYKQAAKLLKNSARLISVDGFLRETHANSIIDAIKQGHTIPIENLQAYQFRGACFPVIKKYCKQRGISLD